MSSMCNVINKLMVEDCIQVNLNIVNYCLKMLKPSKDNDKYRFKSNSLKFSYY